MFPVMPNLRHQLHAPEDRADGAEDVGGERDVFLGRHDDDDEKKIGSLREDVEWGGKTSKANKGREKGFL